MNSITLVILLWLVPCALFSQSLKNENEKRGVISGRVFDAETMIPLDFVNVYLEGTSEGTATGNGGRFSIQTFKNGKHKLIARHIGYKRYEEEISLSFGLNLIRSIALIPTSVPGQEVIVTAAIKEQTVRMSPASVSILRAKDIHTSPVNTFDQVLENAPGITLYRSLGISVQSLSIRGSSDVAGGGVGNRVLLLIDGRPALRPDSGGAFWSLVPTNFIERVEIVKGAFSSLYGSSAMGGVINVITRRPTINPSTRINLKFGFFEKEAPAIRYSDKNLQSKQVEISHSGFNGPIGYLFNVSHKQSDGHAESAEYKFYDFFGKLVYNVNFNHNLELTFGGGFARNDYPHSWLNNLKSLSIKPKYRDDRQEKRHGSVDLHYWVIPNKNTKYESRIYLYSQISESKFNENDPLLTLPGNESFGLKTHINSRKFGSLSQISHSLNDKHYLVTGIDLQFDNIRSSPDTIMYGNHQVNNAAIYIQDEVKIHSKMVATLGLRYDYNHLANGRTLGLMSPKLAFVFALNQNLAIRALFGQAFRAPTIAESFFQVEIAGGTLFKQNPDLQAEKMNYSIETGFKWNFAKLLALDVAFYRYHYKDMIYWINISAEEGVNFPYFQVRNLNRALMQGVEIVLNLSLENMIRGNISYTYLDAQDRSIDRLDGLLAYRPKHNFSFTATLDRRRFNLNLNGRYRSKIEEVFLYPREKPEAFFVFNGKLVVNLSPQISISTAIKNIFDMKYEELARFRSPGRNWMFGITVQP